MANVEVRTEMTAGVSDQELLDRFVVGRDEAAFASLVERHGRTIWGVCRRIVPREHDAQDAYQAVFLVLSRKAASIRHGRAVGSWLYRVAYRIATRARKSLHVHCALESPPDEIARDNPPWSNAAMREMQRILDDEVDRLDEKRRVPFVLCCLEGMSRFEAAREVGWPEETVKARLAQARRLLQSRLARRGITLSAILTAAALTHGTAAAAPVVLAISTGEAVSGSSLALAESYVGAMGLAKFKSAVAAFLLMTMTIGASLATLYLGEAQDGPAAKQVVVVNDPEIFRGPPAHVMPPHDEQVLTLALSPDGKRLVTAGARNLLPGQFMIWDVDRREELVRIRGVRGIRGVAYSPDGTAVACGTFGGIIDLRDAQTGKVVNSLHGHQVGVNAVAYSADGRFLASAGLDSTVKIWDVKESALKHSLTGHTGMVFSVAYCRHGKTIVSGGKDKTARVWDVESGQMRFELKGHPSAVEAVAISPDDKVIATGSWDETVKLWDAETGTEIGILKGGKGLVLGLAFSHDGTLLASTSMGGITYIWDVKSRTLSKRLQGSSSTWGVAFAPDDKRVAAGTSAGHATLWDVETATSVATLDTAQLSRVHDVIYTPDGAFLAIASESPTVQVRDAKSGDLRHVLPGHSDVVRCVAISPDGKTMASGGFDKTIKLWDLASGREIRTLSGHTGAIYALAFAKDGTLASAAADKLVKVWRLKEAAEPITFEGHRDSVSALAFTPDGMTLASGGDDGTIRLWPLGKNSAPRVLTTGKVHALKFAPSGLLASAEDDVVKLWPPGADAASRTLKGHAGPVLALAFTPGGRLLVSGGIDKKSIVWNCASGALLTKLVGHTGSVMAVAIPPNGGHVITGGLDSALLRWPGGAVAEPMPGVAVGPAKPVAKPETPKDIDVSLKSRPDNLPRMLVGGPHAQKWVRFEPGGMRMTISPGFKGMDAHVSLHTGIALKGDFEATVNYEILQLPDQETAGPETGINMTVWRHKSDIVITGISRRIVAKAPSHFSAWGTWFERPNEPSTHSEELTATTAKTGRLRLTRVGGELWYYASESPDAEFKLLNQMTVGPKDLDDLRLVGFTGDPRATLDARFWDLRIRGGVIPRPTGTMPAPEAATTTGERRWLLQVGTVVGLLIVLFGVTFLFLKWQSRSAAIRQRAGATISFACSCGKSLRAKPESAGKTLKCPKCSAPVLVPK